MKKLYWKLLFWRIFFKNFGYVFSRSNTLLAISQNIWSDWCETKNEVHQLDTGWNMRPWPLISLMTVILDFSRSNNEIALSQELLIWLTKKEANWLDTGLTIWLCPLTTPMTLTLVDIPDSGLDDFRCHGHAVDISSFIIKAVFPGIGIPIIKWWSHDHLFFMIMGMLHLERQFLYWNSTQ